MSDSDDDVVAAYLEDIDVRSVTVIWAHDEARPTVTFSGCSVWEAHGLACFAMRVLDIATEPLESDVEETLGNEGDDGA